MGLIKDVKHFKKVKEFEAMVEEVFGKSVKEIKALIDKSEAIMNYRPVQVSEATKQENIQKALNKMTPEQMVEVFAKETEEFYPDGKPQ